MTMVIIGIIAAVAAPRFFDNNVFQSRGFADQVQASLRYAQKIAIAQRRFVCVDLSSNTITLTIDTAPITTAHTTAACGTALTLPSGGAYSISRAGVTITPAPASFNFDALGKPNAGASLLVGTTTITVEAETGYVHQ